MILFLLDMGEWARKPNFSFHQVEGFFCLLLCFGGRGSTFLELSSWKNQLISVKKSDSKLPLPKLIKESASYLELREHTSYESAVCKCVDFMGHLI